MKKENQKPACVDCRCKPVKTHTERINKTDSIARTEYSCGAVLEESTTANLSRVSHSGCSCAV